jgi:hypothetical protein
VNKRNLCLYPFSQTRTNEGLTINKTILNIVCFLSQWDFGTVDQKYRNIPPYTDTRENRIGWFVHCLKQLKALNIKSVGLPYTWCIIASTSLSFSKSPKTKWILILLYAYELVSFIFRYQITVTFLTLYSHRAIAWRHAYFTLQWQTFLTYLSVCWKK